MSTSPIKHPTEQLESPPDGCEPHPLPPVEAGGGVGFVSADRSDDRFAVRYFRRRSDGALVAKVWFGARTQGPPGHAHGGSIAAVLDEAMGGAAWIAGHPVLAAEITVRFKSMLPLGSTCLVESRVDRVDGRKVYTATTMRLLEGDRVIAEGHGLFIALEEPECIGLPPR